MLAACASGAGKIGTDHDGGAGHTGSGGSGGSAPKGGTTGAGGSAKGGQGGGALGGAGGSSKGGSGGHGGAGGSPPVGGSPDGGARDADGYDAPPLVPAGRGATMPWTELEAESANTTGVAVGPDRTFGSIASESSGRRAVRLEQQGQFVEFTAPQRANAIVVRFVTPDAPGGGGATSTLNLYVGGTFKQALTLTSKYAWSYGGEMGTGNDPGMGGAHHFYDEARALIGDVPAGGKVKLQKDTANNAAYYVIDFIDLEYVAPPLAQPANTLSLADCGATPDDGQDDTHALQSCINGAKNMGKGVWIPAGNWDMTNGTGDVNGVEVANVAVNGAGMWYTTLRGPWARFHCIGSGCHFANFAILGDTQTRDDTAVDNGFNGGAGTGSRLENLWVEHTKVGFWVGEGTNNVTNGLVITGCRFRDLFADGVNFCNGTSNSEVVNSHFRNTGDDALATWSPSQTGVNANNVFHFDTVQLPWRANCFGVYGGQDNKVEDNVCLDVVTYPAILVAQQFSSHAFTGTTSVQRNSFIRAGGRFYNQEHGAIKIFSQQGPISGLLFKDITVDSPTYSGLHIQGSNPITNATFDGITIDGAGSYGLLVQAMTSGGGQFTNVVVTHASGGGIYYEPGAGFDLGRGAGDSGW
ncbi:MAG TPA: hypothetical protein VHJ20_21555 [Polyangia bacterium]|nr:hypothetical protein [Polyangia bacterium]